MKRIFTCFFVFLFSLTFYNAFSQTQQAQGFNVSAFNTNTVTVSWTNNADGARAGYIVYANTTGVFADPSGALPTADADLSNGAAVVLLSNTATTLKFGNGGSGADLPSNTHYYFKIFAYATGPVAYLTGAGVPTADHFTLADVPTNASTMTFSSVTANSMSVSATVGNGAYRLLIAREGAAVTFAPSDGTSYSALVSNNYTTATEVGTAGQGNKIVGLVTGATATFSVVGMNGDKDYFFTWIEANGTDGSGAENYVGTTPLTGSRETEPTTQANTLNFSAIGTTGLTLNWSVGNGDRRVVLIHQGAAVDADPADFTSYTTVSSNWNSGSTTATQIGTGNYIVFDGTATNVAMTNLIANTVYHFVVYEYNGTNLATATYMTPGATANHSTLASQPTGYTTLAFSSVTANSMTATAGGTAGTGATRMVVVRPGSAVSFVPADGVSYTTGINSDYSAATEVGTAGQGNKIIYVGTGTSFPVTAGLSGDTNYFFAVYEFNGTAGSGAENYAAAAPTGSRQTEPTTQANTLSFSAIGTTGLTLNWSVGNGDRRVVLIHEGAAVDADPADFTSYTTVSSNWNSGSTTATQIGTGNYIVFDGTATNVAMTNLIANTVYHFAVYEYNGTNLATATYMTPGATANHSTLASQPTGYTTLAFSSVTANSMTATAGGTAGTGATRMVVVRPGSAVNFVPADGVSYTTGISSDYSAATEVGTAGQGNKIIYVGTGTSFPVTAGLSGDTNYFFAVYEFNGTAGSGAENYAAAAPTGSRQTEPTTQANTLNFSAIGTTGLTLNWSVGNGDRRVVLIHEGAAVDADPADFTSYTTVSSNWNSGSTTATQIGTGNYIVFDGTATNVAMTNLIANTVYHFAVYEYNGTNLATATYMTPGATANHSTLASQPTGYTTLAFSSVTANSMTATAGGTAGTGATRMVVVRPGSAVSFVPADGVSYTTGINSDYSAATEVGTAGQGNKIIYVGTGTSFPVTAGLSGDTNYFFAVYEFNGTAGSGAENYAAAAPTGSRQTEPTTQANTLNFSAFSTTGLTLNWSVGNGDRRVVLIHQGAAVDADPADFTSYTTVSSNWNSGSTTATQIGTGNYIVFDGTGTSVAMTNLIANTVYYFAVYEYNGTNLATATYMTPGATANRTTLAAAVTPNNSSAINFSGTTGSQTTLTWTNGNGASRVVVGHEAAAVNANPQSGTGYTFNSVFADPTTEIGTDNFIVYNGSGNTVTVTGLNSGTQYFFRVYDYNGSGLSANYSIATPTNNPNDVTTSVGTANTITSTGTAAEPASFSALIDAEAAAVLNFDFKVTDDGATPGADNSSTRISGLTINRKDLALGDVDDWSLVIAGAEFSGPAASGTTTVLASSITANQIIFTGIPSNNPSGNAELGRINDNGSKTYVIKLWLKSPMDAATAAAIDNQVIVMKITDADFVINGGSAFLPSQTLESGDAKNAVDVVRSKIVIKTPPSTSAFASVALATQPIFEAVDAHGNRDQNFTEAITIVTSNPDNLSSAGAPSNFASGLADFTGSGFNFVTIGTSTMKLTTPSITAANSAATATITVSGSNESVITENSSFFAPSGFDYSSYQRLGSLNGLTTLGGILKVGSFTIYDGGLDNFDIDGVSTRLSDIQFTVTGAANIRSVGIDDGGILIPSIIQTQPGGATVTFSGLPAALTASDGGTKTFGIWVSFNAPVTDNQHFEFQITSATAVNSGSVFQFPDAGQGSGGATTSTNGTDNQVTVFADRLQFFQNASNTLIGKAMSLPPSVEAVDGLGSRDLNYSGLVTLTSTGVLNGTPTASMISGLGVFAPIIHDDKANTRQLTATLASLPSPDALSNTFNLTASNQSDVVLVSNATFPEPLNIPYINYITSTAPFMTSTEGIAVAQFRIRDSGAGPADLDGAPTYLKDITFNVSNSSYMKRIALFTPGGTNLGEVSAGSTVSFTNLNSGFGYGVVDDNSVDFIIRVTFNQLAPVIDNSQFQFTVTSVVGTPKSSDYISGSGGGAFSTVAGNENKIEVVATKYIFTTAPSSAVFANIPFASPIVLEARDLYNARDLDYTGTVNVTNATNIPMTDAAGHTSVTTVPSPFVAGVLTMNNQLRYDNGDGVFANGSLTFTDASSTIPAIGSTVTVSASSSSDIIEDLTSFSYPNNLDYKIYNAGNIDHTADDEIKLGQFKIRDGGTSTDLDGTGTELKSINFTVTTGSANLARVMLYDETNSHELGEVAVSGSTISFPTLAFPTIAGDNSSIILSLWATFKTTVTDNQKIAFQVAAVTSNPKLSTFADPTAAGGATTNLTGTQNQIEVTVANLIFTSIPTTGTIGTPFSPVEITAEDTNGNTDLDFVSPVSAFSNDGGATMINTPFTPDPIASFSAGVLTLSPSFAFTSTPAANSHLSISAGGKTGTSATSFTVTASKESLLDYTGTFVTRLSYISKQSTNIASATDPNSEMIAQFILRDGNGLTPDIDNAPTTISQVQLEISTTDYLGATVLGSTDIRQIALYDASGNEYGEQTLNSATTVTFNIGALLSAPDGGSTVFQVRASFNTGSGNIHDADNIRIRVIKVLQGAGSQLDPGAGKVTAGTWNAGTGVVATGGLTPSTANLVDVLATQLVFTTPPGSVAGINQPTTEPVVEARDANNLLDIEQSINATITTPSGGAALNSTNLPFSLGVLNFPGFQYTDVGSNSSAPSGNGTLSIASRNNLGNNITGTSPGRVDVYDVQATGVTGGVITTPNLAGGSINKVIFGVTFSSTYSQGGNPKLNQFTIRFSNNISSPQILKNFRVFESTSSTGFGGQDITTGSIAGTVALGTPQEISPGVFVPTLVVKFTTNPRDLSLPLTYYLEVDIDANANGGTPAVTPSLVDAGFSDPISDGNIVTSAGSASGSVTGNTYSFAAIFPPTLVSSIPSSGQTNVDPNQSTIDLTFSVPVWSLDEKVYLHDGITSDTVAILDLDTSSPINNGHYPGTIDVNTLASPIRFKIPPSLLQKNHLYFITIAPGDFGGNGAITNAGIMDQSNNLFPGITFSGTLYFKTANPNPVQIVTTKTPAPYTAALDPSINNRSLNGATISATFDQKGTAYFIVVAHNATTPTVSEIKGTGAYQPAIQSGTISSSTGSSTVNGTSTSFTSLHPGDAIYNAAGTSIIGNVATILSNTQLTLTSLAKVNITLGAYSKSTAIYQSSFSINQVAPISQVGVINAITPLTPGATYDVWMASDNDALPLSIGTSSHYGSNAHAAKTGTITTQTTDSLVVGTGTLFTTEFFEGQAIFNAASQAIGTIQTIIDNTHLTFSTDAFSANSGVAFFGPSFEVGAPGPTLTFDAVSPPAGFSVNKPSINICSSSYQILTTPIVIGESTAKSEFSGASGVDQIFNLVLPSGFTYDASLDGSSAPVYGKLTLSTGADFVAGSGKLSFIGNTVLKVTFRNSGNASADNMIISGLRVASTGAAGGSITRLGGNAFPGVTVIGDGLPVATLNANPAPTITFTNSYSLLQFGNSSVTTIPDQFTLTDPNTGRDSTYTKIELIPLSNTGLPLYSVGDFGPSSFSGTGVNINQLSLNSPTLGTPFNVTITHTDNNGCVSQNPVQYVVYDHNTAIKIVELSGAASPSPYCITNANFIAEDNDHPFVSQNADTTLVTLKRSVKFNNTSAYLLASLKVDASGRSDQPFGAPGWLNLLQTIPTVSQFYDALANDPIPGGSRYYDYTINLGKILNANSLSGGALLNPYEYFKKNIQVNGVNYFYYEGGSLGTVRLSAIYQSIANQNVRITLKQNVEVYIPAVPLVLVGEGNRTDLILDDPANTAGTLIGPRRSIGTPVFCEAGGLIALSGYPQPSSGTSIGFFTLTRKDGAPLKRIDNGPIDGTVFIDNGNGTATLDPSKVNANNTDIVVTYSFQPTSPNGTGTFCTSSSSQIIRVAPNPTVSYTTGDLCEGLPKVQFTGTTAPVGLSIKTWAWNFGDANSPQNSASIASPDHQFTQFGTFSNVNVVVTSSNNCPSAVESKDLLIGSKPNVSFNITGMAKDLTFTNTTVIDQPGVGSKAAILYQYGDGIQNSSGVHTYEPGNYTVTLIVTSNAGCADTTSRPVVALPSYKADSTSTYLQDFELDSGAWQTYVRAGDPPASWKYGQPVSSSKPTVQHILDSLNSIDALLQGDGINRMWATNLNGSYNLNERSSLYSPVFDISDLQRPMVSFNSFVEMLGSDGVVLQYSIDDFNIADDQKVWIPLGVIGDGVDWYNEQGLSSKPGDQPINPLAWSKRGGVAHDWLESKHSLDALNKPEQVVFRFALASNFATPPNVAGFAVDNFRLGNRTRTVLVENFKNLGNGTPAESSEADYLSNFNTAIVGTEMIKINYDVGFPAADPFNIDNGADPSARALYYNIAATPLARLDGRKNASNTDTPFSNWGDITYQLRSLQLAQANIDILNLDQTGGDLKFSIKVKPVTALGPTTTLHVVVVEQAIEKNDLSTQQQDLIKTDEMRFEYVVKKMLPNAAGTRFNVTYDSSNLPPLFEYSFTPTPSRFYGTSPTNISVIAFIQDADTREIKQSRAFRNLNSPSSTVTGLPPGAEAINIYPNPASSEFKIELPEAAKQQVSVMMMDQVGKIVHETVIPQGAKNKTVFTQDLAEGVYILHLNTGNGTMLRTKIMVIHYK